MFFKPGGFLATLRALKQWLGQDVYAPGKASIYGRLAVASLKAKGKKAQGALLKYLKCALCEEGETGGGLDPGLDPGPRATTVAGELRGERRGDRCPSPPPASAGDAPLRTARPAANT